MITAGACPTCASPTTISLSQSGLLLCWTRHHSWSTAMSARTTRKRARPDSQDWEAAETQEAGGEQAGMAGADRKRDEEFWFEDGNVMLVARDVEFRVFKGILADHSPVFKDMFSLPQPPEYATALCPVVHVTDAPEDLRHLLRVYMPKTEPRFVIMISRTTTTY